MRNFLLYLILFTSSITTVLSQTKYYVDQERGSDTNNGKSSGAAFQSIEKALDLVKTAKAGTIYIMGEYHNSSYDPKYNFSSVSDSQLWHSENTIDIIGVNGTASNWITITAYTGDASRPTVIKGDGANIINVKKCSYLEIKGLNILGEKRIPLSTSLALQFKYKKSGNNTIYDRLDDQTDGDTSADGVASISEDKTEFTKLGSVTRPSYIDTRGMYLHEAPLEHIKITDNTISYMPGGGLRVSDGKYIDIVGNDIYRNSRRSYSGTHGLVVTKTLPTDKPGEISILIEKNKVHHNYNEMFSWAPTKTMITPRIDEGKGISLQRNNLSTWIEGNGRILVQNNIAYWNGFSGIHSNDGYKIDFVNNTSFMNSYTNSVEPYGINGAKSSEGQNGGNIGISTSDGFGTCTMSNNIVVIDDNWDGKALAAKDGDLSEAYNNVIYGIGGHLSEDPDVKNIDVKTKIANPNFVNAPTTFQDENYAFNFNIKSNSVAIDYAKSSVAPNDDYLGNNRGSSPDSGALEYSSIQVSSISVTSESNKTEITVIGETLQMKATVSPENAADNTVTWSVNDESVATIDENGLLTSISEGSVTVKAVANDGSGVKSTLVITVSASSSSVLVSNIDVAGVDGIRIIDVNKGTLQMLADILPANAGDKSVTWEVTPTAISPGEATISSTGLITAISDGKVKVTATANDGSGIVGKKYVIISNQTAADVLVTELTVLGENGNEINVNGGTLQMLVDVLPTNATNKDVSWSVKLIDGNTGNATISADGILTAISDGKVRVVAKANDGSGIVDRQTITIANQTGQLGKTLSVVDNVEDKVEIFSNSKSIYIKTSQQLNNVNVELYNINGKMVLDTHFDTIISKQEIKTNHNNGIYILRVITEDGSIVKKIIF